MRSMRIALSGVASALALLALMAGATLASEPSDDGLTISVLDIGTNDDHDLDADVDVDVEVELQLGGTKSDDLRAEADLDAELETNLESAKAEDSKSPTNIAAEADVDADATLDLDGHAGKGTTADADADVDANVEVDRDGHTLGKLVKGTGLISADAVVATAAHTPVIAKVIDATVDAEACIGIGIGASAPTCTPLTDLDPDPDDPGSEGTDPDAGVSPGAGNVPPDAAPASPGTGGTQLPDTAFGVLADLTLVGLALVVLAGLATGRLWRARSRVG